MPLASEHGRIGKVKRRKRLRIALALLFLAVMPLALRLYVVQEIFFVVLSVALTFIALLPVLVVLLVLQVIGRSALPRLKTNIARLAAWSHMQLWADRLRARF
jgi:hypothetical protein